MKLTEKQAARIKKLLAEGKTQTSVAEKFGVSVPAIHYIATGKTHADVAPAGPRKARTGLDANQVSKIKLFLLAGVSQTKIAEKFGVTPAMVTYIKQGKTHADVPAATLDLNGNIVMPETAA